MRTLAIRHRIRSSFRLFRLYLLHEMLYLLLKHLELLAQRHDGISGRWTGVPLAKIRHET